MTKLQIHENIIKLIESREGMFVVTISQNIIGEPQYTVITHDMNKEEYVVHEYDKLNNGLYNGYYTHDYNDALRVFTKRITR